MRTYQYTHLICNPPPPHTHTPLPPPPLSPRPMHIESVVRMLTAAHRPVWHALRRAPPPPPPNPLPPPLSPRPMHIQSVVRILTAAHRPVWHALLRTVWKRLRHSLDCCGGFATARSSACACEGRGAEHTHEAQLSRGTEARV